MKPILFNTAMVQAILEGRKTQTRRIVKVADSASMLGFVYADSIVGKRKPNKVGCVGFDDGSCGDVFVRPAYQIGDILYIRETWAKWGIRPLYKADNVDDEFLQMVGLKWKPSIHMPKADVRIFLKVTNVRVERLQNISAEDAIAEGCWYGKGSGEIDHPVGNNLFQNLWNSINGKDAWEQNPYVFVYEFEKVEKPEANNAD